MNCSVAIMAHEKRAKRIDYLVSELGDVQVFMDRGNLGEPDNLGPWRNAKRAWAAYDPTADFHMVVQDDVVFGKQFKRRVLSLIDKYGKDFAYCLFANINGRFVAGEFKEQLKKPQGIAKDKELYWAQAVILPTSIIDDMLIYGDKCEYDRGRGTWFDDDARISEYLKSIKMKVIYPIPSLVNQDKKFDSLVGYGHNKGRQAKHFI
jgi:hypothetical protein